MFDAKPWTPALAHKLAFSTHTNDWKTVSANMDFTAEYLTTGANTSLKSMPSLCVNPFATNRAFFFPCKSTFRVCVFHEKLF